MSPILSVKRGFALVLAGAMILGCFTGCRKSRTTLPEAPTEPTSYLVLDPTVETTETETQPTETEATEAPTTEPVKETQPDGLTGTVVGNYVNIRNGPGTNYGSSETLEEGTPVLIQELDLEGSLPWGRIDQGWVCLDYVRLDSPDEVLSYTSSAVGISIHNGIPLYDGPGSFYTQIGTLSKDVRLNIFGIFGNWGRISEGWILMDHVYVDGKQGPSAPVMGTVSGDGVYIRTGPGTEYGTVTSYSSGARVKVLYRTTIQGLPWGCLENGWICMNYVLLDSDPAAAILGTWYGHTMQSMDQIDHTFSEWTFDIDGTYSRTKWYYNENTKELSKFQDGHSSGEYTFDGTKLVLDGKECAAYVDGGKLYINEGHGMKAHVKTSMNDAIEAFLAEKYPPAPEPPAGGETPPSGDGETPPEGGETPPSGDGETPPDDSEGGDS